MSIYGEPDERALDALEARVTAHIEFEEEMARIDAHLSAERRTLLDSGPPRGQCPGCFAAIYDGARKQGWCCDCFPQRAKYEKQAYGR